MFFGIISDPLHMKKVDKNNKTGMAAKYFVYGFLKRHPELLLIEPKETALDRVFCVNKEQVDIRLFTERN